MSNITVPYPKPGIAMFEKLDNWVQNFLLAGEDPELWSYPFVVAINQTLVAGQVVGFDGSGHIIPAVLGTTAAIGVMTQGVTTGGTLDGSGVPVWRSGCFNRLALTFDASYGTTAQQFQAFEGASSPTTITLRDRPIGLPNT